MTQITLGADGNLVAAEAKNKQMIIKLKDGDVVIDMFTDVAPGHCARLEQHANNGFYNGLTWHRVIEGFMAQGGCPLGTGGGGGGEMLKAEFSDIKHRRGTCSMARAQHPDSASSQFFICFADAPFLDGQYTVWGQVVSGMEFVDNIKRGEPVIDPDIMIEVKVVEV